MIAQIKMPLATWTKSRGRVEVGEGGGFGWSGVEGWGENATTVIE